MTPRITVLLAVRNGLPYVRESVASVLAQTFGDFELLVVDDASTDGTPEYVSSLGDERIRLLRNDTNLGQAPSLNRGLREARGEYVARLDADDYCRPTRLERQLAILDAEPSVGLVGTWMDLVEERGRPISQLRSSIPDFTTFVFHTLIMQVLVAHPAAMYRREAALAAGGYDESTAPAEDKDLWRKLALGRWDARIVEEPLVVYRVHDAQLSRTRTAYQQEVDGVSQDRFLAALAPRSDVRPLRLLLAGDPRFWAAGSEAEATMQTLDAVLSGTRTELGLDASQVARLDGLLAEWILAVARRQAWRRRARQLAAVVLTRLPPEQQLVERRRTAAAVAYAPVKHAAATTGRMLAAGVYALPGADAVRRAGRRSRVARRVYAKLVGDQ